MPISPPRSIRVLPELRAVHVERLPLTTPAEVLFFQRKYDLGREPLPAGVRQIGLAGALLAFWRSPADRLEMPEPLWMRFLPRAAILTAAFRLTGLVRGRRRSVCSYAMENNDLDRLVSGRATLATPFRAIAKFILGSYTRLAIDRLAFATPAASATYNALPFVKGLRQRTFIELPAGTPRDDLAIPTPNRAVFVGVLESRKGLPELLQAWERIESDNDSAHLTIVGPGPLAATAAQWAARRPASRRYTGPLSRPGVLDELARATVLLAPSIPEGRWREQVGLPLKEALSVGATVVTTCQTGLATWLAEHGHSVVSVDGPDFVQRFAAAGSAALARPLARADVVATLPRRDARLDADSWLHERDAR